MKISLILSMLLLISSCIYCQSFGERFISSLINGSNPDSYIQPEELSISDRFGISYEGIKQKFFIAYDIDENIKSKIRNGSLKYSLKGESEKNRGRIIFTVPGYSQTFILLIHWQFLLLNIIHLIGSRRKVSFSNSI